jgi:hypothetical protein
MQNMSNRITIPYSKSTLKENVMASQPSSDLRVRTKKFALRIIKLYQQLPKSGEAQVLGKQVLRSGTSVGAQYREACGPNLQQISSAKWKEVYKSWMKLPIGWNCL